MLKINALFILRLCACATIHNADLECVCAFFSLVSVDVYLALRESVLNRKQSSEHNELSIAFEEVTKRDASFIRR